MLLGNVIHFQASVKFTKKLYRKKNVHNVLLVCLAVRFAHISSIFVTSHCFEKGILIMIKGEKQVPS